MPHAQQENVLEMEARRDAHDKSPQTKQHEIPRKPITHTKTYRKTDTIVQTVQYDNSLTCALRFKHKDDDTVSKLRRVQRLDRHLCATT